MRAEEERRTEVRRVAGREEGVGEGQMLADVHMMAMGCKSC